MPGPLLDRIDVHVEVPSLAFCDPDGGGGEEASSSVAARVAEARVRQARRLGAGGNNAAMSPRQIRSHCGLDRSSRELLRSAAERLRLSARATARTLKVARTIADLAGRERIEDDHVAEAVQYRAPDHAPV